MQGKIVVMTGATSGIGAVAAGKLAEAGATIFFIARDQTRAQATLERLAAKSAKGASPHRAFRADLSSLAEISRVGAEIAAEAPRIDVLVNNAGAIFASRRVTGDGLEMTFALNHMSYFILTKALAVKLEASAPARIVSTASSAHQGAKLDFDDLQSERNYGSLRAYGRSKLANILFTRELARRLAGTGVLGSVFWLAKLLAIKPEKGAETIVYLVSSPEVAADSGYYFADRRKVTPSTAAQDDVAARKLWAASENLAGPAA
jgi:NAD(P)-dependent dehydrogenase (short-subunit alcohol dehydrogenase family)